MPKTISIDLAQHLAGEVTTLATCWKITRRDGVVLGFTDHVRDLEVDGVTYVAASGYTRTAIRSTADLAVDNLDVESVFSDEGITEADLRAGRYDFAEVRMFLVDYEDLGQGILKLRRGWLGEVGVRDGMYVAELRGMTQKLQMTVGELFTPDCAADLGDARCGVDLTVLDESGTVTVVILASAWVERDGFELFLPPSFLELDPGDVVEVETVGETLTATLRLRLTEIDLSGGWLLRLKGVADDPVVWQTSHAIGAPTPASQQTSIPFEVPSQGFFLNLPALSAEDGQTGAFWLGTAPAWSLDNATWRGAVIYRSGDGVTFTDYTAITTAVAWAKARTVLPLLERWGVWDEDNALDVLVQSPGLQFESKTELEVLDGANLLLVGQEIVQFVDAEQLGASEWRLSKMLRGRRGTEWAMGTHQVGESVLVLDPATFTRASSLDEVGLARFYRAVSIGTDPSLPEAVGFTNEAASLKPYAPVRIRGSRDGAGDLTITWIRRTRFGGEWRDLVDVPLNEMSEAYEVDVLDGAGNVVRTLASATPSVVYAAADQTTDFGAPEAAIDVAVYQVSAAVGCGFAGRATL